MAAVKRMGVKMGAALAGPATGGLATGSRVGVRVGSFGLRMQEPESWILGIGGLTLLGLALGVLG